MGWGGARVGAGRKPGTKRAVLLGMDGSRLERPPTPEVTSVPDASLAQPPKRISAAQRRVWRDLAPFALAQRTLTAATAPGFAQVCKLMALQDRLERRLYKLGPEMEAADEILARYLKLTKDLDPLLKNFKLTAFGKPETAAAPAQTEAANPWAQVAGQ